MLSHDLELNNYYSTYRLCAICRILALGTNQHFNLSYIDPTTSQLRFCSVNCTLSSTGASSHDFQVVSPILASGVQISVNSWHGAGGGLAGVEIFQSGK